MRSLDTNIVVRSFTEADTPQAILADRLLTGSAYLTPTVLLETSWVLSSIFGWSAARIADDLRDLLAMPQMAIAQRNQVSWAIERYAAGADFADMMHLALSGGSDCFTTFDRDIARFAEDSVVPVETLRA